MDVLPFVRRLGAGPRHFCLSAVLNLAVFGLPLAAQPFSAEGPPELIVVLAPATRAPHPAEVVEQVNARGPLPGILGFGGPVEARFVLPYRATGETLALLEADPESPRAQIERAVVLTYLRGADLESIRKVLAEDPQVDSAGENARFPASVVPNDPWFAAKVDPLQYQWGPYLLGLPPAWDRIRGHAYLGAIETGVQSNHPDLQAFASTSYKGGPYRPHLSWDFAGNDNNADELQNGLGVLGTAAAGHGTHVAGILAGTANNSVGVAGTCWGCSVLIGRNNMSEAQVLAALTWLVDHGVQVVNAADGPWEETRVAGVPAAPSHLTTSSVDRFNVALQWRDNSDNETQFRIERRTMGTPFRDIGGALDSSGLIEFLEPDTIYIFRVRARNAAGDSPYSNEAIVSTHANPKGCSNDETALCLQKDRFRIRAHWLTAQGAQGEGNPVELTPDTGYFWFFDPANVEMIVKVLDACALNNRYWVFAGGLTDVQVIWTVTDTRVGRVRTYVNPPGTAFQPVQDTDLDVEICGAGGL